MDASVVSNAYDGLSATVMNGHGPKPAVAVTLRTVAQNGDTIVVAAGTYYESIWDLGTNNVTIIPQGTVTIDVDGWPPILSETFTASLNPSGWYTADFSVIFGATGGVTRVNEDR